VILTGRVTLNGSLPAQHAVVELHNSRGDVMDQMQVDRSGIYAFHLIPGTWSVRAWDNQGRRALAKIKLGDRDTVFDINLTEREGTSDE
jgi:Protein of unknown function (DUF1416)